MTLLRRLPILGLGSLCLWLLVDKTAHSSGDKDLARQLTELQEARRELGTCQQALRAEQSGHDPAATAVLPGTAGPAVLPAAAAPPPPQAPPVRPRPARKPSSPDELQVGLDNAFYGEPEDVEWSQRAQRLVQTGMEKALGPEAQVASVHCASTMCRIETRHHSREHYEQFLAHTSGAAGPGPWNGAFFSAMHDNAGSGEVTAISFLAREGKFFPTLADQ